MNVTHLTFDLLAWVAAMISGVMVYRWRLARSVEAFATSTGTSYFVSLLLGAVLGAYLLGSLNLYFSDVPGFGRSVLGAIAGAVLFIEIYKSFNRMEGSTGWLFVIPLTVSITIGRFGCFLSGSQDFTYGTPSNVPWSWDYGDGVLRHPVQLYEAMAMLFCALFAVILLNTRPAVFVAKGFYLWILLYASQRLIWEFFKPYGTVIGNLNIFHLTCIALVIYALFMLTRVHHVQA